MTLSCGRSSNHSPRAGRQRREPVREARTQAKGGQRGGWCREPTTGEVGVAAPTVADGPGAARVTAHTLHSVDDEESVAVTLTRAEWSAVQEALDEYYYVVEHSPAGGLRKGDQGAQRGTSGLAPIDAAALGRGHLPAGWRRSRLRRVRVAAPTLLRCRGCGWTDRRLTPAPVVRRLLGRGTSTTTAAAITHQLAVKLYQPSPSGWKSGASNHPVFRSCVGPSGR